MSKVFISYRHVTPDQELAVSLSKYLKERKHEVFIDLEMRIGTKWVTEIERQIKDSDCFVVFLSKDSIRSDMVRQEVEVASKHIKEDQKEIVILPVRVAFEGELPYDLGAYLNRIQYARWREGSDFNLICDQIGLAIEQSVALPQQGKADKNFSTSGIKELAEATELIGAPLPAADLRLVLESGTVKLGSPFYIRRGADDEMEEQVSSTGTTTVLKGMRQMGKSSLLARVYAAAGQQQKACYIDFQSIADTQLESLESLLKYLAHKLAKSLKISIAVDEYWDDYLGPKESITSFLEELLSREGEAPVLILFDEVDRVFNHSYRNDFFSTLRVWHNLRATKSIWDRLNIVITHSTEPYLWIDDINQSPFNVGHPVRLEDFDFSQVCELNSKHRNPLKTEDEVRELMVLVGGQPYLARQALYSLAVNNRSLPQFLKIATDETGPFGDHLRRYLWSLQKQKGLKEGLRDVLRRGLCDDETVFQRLKSAGLVYGETRHSVRTRCKLYDDYFRKHL